MSPEEELIALNERLETLASCPNTIGGWIWYCWEHDSHGTADYEDEAGYVAEAHALFHDGGEDCAITLVGVQP